MSYLSRYTVFGAFLPRLWLLDISSVGAAPLPADRGIYIQMSNDAARYMARIQTIVIFSTPPVAG